MAQTIYIDADIGGTGGAGTEGDPYRSWTDFHASNGSRDLVDEGVGIVTVYIKGELTDPNVNTIRFDVADATVNGSNYFRFEPWPGFESADFDEMPGFVGGIASTASNTQVVHLGPFNSIKGLKVFDAGTGTNQGLVHSASSGSNVTTIEGCWVRVKGDAIVYTVGAKVRNNIAETATGHGLRAGAASAGGIELDHNTVIATGEAGTGIDPRSSSAVVKNNVVYAKSGASWEAEYGATNPHANSANNAGTVAAETLQTSYQTGYVQITTDPFVNLANGDYHPVAEGQLDGAGVASSITTDFAGVTRANPPSIGALEVAQEEPALELEHDPAEVLIEGQVHTIAYPTKISMDEPILRRSDGAPIAERDDLEYAFWRKSDWTENIAGTLPAPVVQGNDGETDSEGMWQDLDVTGVLPYGADIIGGVRVPESGEDGEDLYDLNEFTVT